VLDERLPGVSGLAALARLRARGVGLPAVLITTHPLPILREAARAAGVEILEKPLLGDGLVRWIRGALEA
jgi:FixJ family two-component response regulator